MQKTDLKTPDGITQRTLRGLFWVFMSQGAEAILYLVILAILARLLTPADFGVIAVAMMVIQFGRIFSQFGIGSTVVQRPEMTSLHLRSVFTISWICHILLATGLVFAAPAVAAFFRLAHLSGVLQWLALLFVLQGISIVAESLLQRELQFRLLAAVDVITFVVGYGLVGIVLALRGFGVWALVGGLLAQMMLKTLALLMLSPHPKKPTFHRTIIGELSYYAGGFSAGHLAGFFAHQGDKFIVGRWLGADALGSYTRAYELMAAPSKFLGGIFDKALFPAMAAVQSDQAQLSRTYRRGVAVIALLILPTSPILIILAPEMVDLLLGAQWSAVVLPLQILSIAALFRMEYRMSDSLVRASGTVMARAWRQSVYALVVIGCTWVGQYSGLPGVSFGVLAAITLHFGLMIGLSLRLSALSWRIFLAAHLPAVKVTLLMGTPVWVVATVLRRWETPPVLVLTVAGSVVGLMALGILWYAPIRLLGVDGIWMMNRLLAQIPDRFKPLMRVRQEEPDDYPQ